jgi:hypothetical protein
MKTIPHYLLSFFFNSVTAVRTSCAVTFNCCIELRSLVPAAVITFTEKFVGVRFSRSDQLL